MKKQLENKNGSKIEGKFEKNEKGENILVALQVGNLYVDFLNKEKEKQPSLKELDAAITETLGLPNTSTALDVIFNIAASLPEEIKQSNFNRIVALIADQKPKDSVEAILLGQFFLLNEIGTHLWRRAFNSDMIFQGEYFSKTAVKFLSLSHQAIHTLAKHKTKGVQQVNVVHMHDNSKAIMAGEIGGRDK